MSDEILVDSPWWVIEGDDHEQRVAECATEEEALADVAADFSDQYGEDYSRDLLVVLGKFDTLEDAMNDYPDAT